ncbi:hypothetical protein FBBAL38_05080 [Flavobacteria bacterium BAL38]|nr:hypothetical protein FBBAL38_05080 [Flavobacteria bacterium BAL38]
MSKLTANIRHNLLLTRVANIFITYGLIVSVYSIFCNLAEKCLIYEIASKIVSKIKPQKTKGDNTINSLIIFHEV